MIFKHVRSNHHQDLSTNLDRSLPPHLPGHEPFTGRAKRVTITVPEDLEAAIKAEIGDREFSAYASEALARRYQHDQLAKTLAQMEAEEGPIPADVQARADAVWPDAEPDHRRNKAA